MPETISVSVPETACTATLLTGAENVVLPATVIVAVGTPVNTMLLAPDETVVLEANVSVTVAALPPNMKLFPVVVINAPDVVMRFVPVSGPTIDTPYPPDVMVDESTVRPVAEAAPT